MTLNNEIRIQFQTIERTEFLFLLSNIRENIKSYD